MATHQFGPLSAFDPHQVLPDLQGKREIERLRQKEAPAVFLGEDEGQGMNQGLVLCGRTDGERTSKLENCSAVTFVKLPHQGVVLVGEGRSDLLTLL